MSLSSIPSLAAGVLQGFREGREDCFDTLFRSWYPSLVYFTSQITHNRPAAEDIVEEVFVKVWSRRSQFTDWAGLRSYLYTSARNGAFTWCRLEKRRQEIVSGEMPEWPAWEPASIEALIRAELLHQLHEALESLPGQCRRIMKMIFMEGMNSREVAEALNLSVGTVKTQKARGILLLRSRLPYLVILFTWLKLA